ncbi:hypothetical protein ACFQ0B_37045 [Nonomuraea thailandensis]
MHLFEELLAQALATDGGRSFAVERVCTGRRFGAALARSCGRCSWTPTRRCWPVT